MADIIRIHPRNDPTHSTAPGTITAAELKALLGWLGLSVPWLAKRLKVRDRTVIRWCDGDAPIPEEAAAEMVRAWNQATATVSMMVANAATNADTQGVVVLTTYRVDADYWNDARTEEFPATYHRALACRAMDHLLMRTKYRVQIRYRESENQ